ncbi:hypothetical protein [Akkermansia sp.]|uniref:hypothetical protein n=1 Tax=Akkermansia sp. TaxID=1872421 RepID=UPI0025B85FC4|nr:hypothetical protein [Akkermansia sp.]MCC8147811.1 hypothetical protein [Akkermansia sp.]
MWKIRFPVKRGIQGRVLSYITITGIGQMQDARGTGTAIFGKVGAVPEEVFQALKTGRGRGEGRSSNGPGETGFILDLCICLEKYTYFFNLLLIIFNFFIS